MTYNRNSRTYDDPAQTAELNALLEELNDVGGMLRTGEASEKVLAGGREGTVGSTAVLSEQSSRQISFAQRRSSAHTATGFSTYTPSPSTSDAEPFSNTTKPTPLGVRLAPVKDNTRKEPLPEGRRSSFQPPPPLSGGLVAQPLPVPPPPTVEEEQPPTEEPSLEVDREANFLPVMCARYLRPSGLTPQGRWGHTLTPVGFHQLYMFGGKEVGGEESNLLCEFNTTTITWDPVPVRRGAPPAPRHDHAAATLEERFVIIHGGCAHRAGGKPPEVFADLHMYDTITSEWVCLWSGQSTPANKNVPTARFGHTIVIQDDSLYVYGGKTLKAGSVDSSLATSDVFVFSLNSKRWRRRLRAGKPRQVESEATTPSAKQTDLPPNGATAVPLPRAHHAVCVKDHVMFMNGGSGANSATLNDTWSLDLSTGVWTCLHAGEGADAIPRERHALLVCGEALLLMGGCTASMYSEKITEKYFNFVAVLPLLGQPIPCWIPVSMGNVSVVPPSRRGFAAAFSGGFAYVFGGMSGSEPASNNMVRFLSADGYVSTGARMTATANDAALRNTMQRTRRRPVIPFDVYISPGSWSGSEVEKGNMVGAHRVLLQQRAPILLKALQGCRSQPLHTTASRVVKGKADEEEQDDLLKDFVKQVNTEEGTKVSTTNTGTGGTVYFTSGNTRVVGLPHPLTAQELEALMDYVYWGGLSSEFRTLLEEEEEKEQDENTNHHSSIESTKDLLRKVLASLQQAATDFELAPLSSLCDALLSKSKKKLTKSRAKSVKTLRDDLLTLRTSSSLATATVLFVDPHTGQQTAHTLHPLLLSASSSFFADLLRPLYNGEKTQSQLGPVAAKVTLPPGEHGGLLTSTSKRAVLVGPVSIPTLAVEPVLRFLYSMELQAPRDMVFDVLLGSHVLNLPPLQAYCEAIVARTEVNYDTCCSFYYIARRYGASLLEEMALLTAVTGYSQVQHSIPYLNLSKEDRQQIDALSKELHSSSWVPPPQPTSVLRPTEEYAKRWNESSLQ